VVAKFLIPPLLKILYCTVNKDVENEGFSSSNKNEYKSRKKVKCVPLLGLTVKIFTDEAHF
jgi:hypothetical protein